MRRFSLLALAGWTVFAGGCFFLDSPDGVSGRGGSFDDDDDDGGSYLASGSYVRMSGSSVDPMTCGVGTSALFAQYEEIDVLASGDYLEMDFDGHELHFEFTSGLTFEDQDSPYLVDVDFSNLADAAIFGLEATADCVLACEIRYDGEVLGYDLFTLEDSFRLEMLSGTECAGVATSAGFAMLPCEDVGHTTWAL